MPRIKTKIETLQNRDSKGEKKKEKILLIAQNLFWQNGYDGTSIQQIADKARVNKATIYYYFESKPVLLYEIAAKSLKTLTDMADEVINSNLSSQEKLQKLIYNQICWSLEHPRNAAAVLLERRSLPPKLLKKIIATRDYYEGHFRQLFAELMPVEKALHIDSKLASLFSFGLMFSLTNWYRKDGKLSPDEIAAKVYMYISGALGIGDSSLNK